MYHLPTLLYTVQLYHLCTVTSKHHTVSCKCNALAGRSHNVHIHTVNIHHTPQTTQTVPTKLNVHTTEIGLRGRTRHRPRHAVRSCTQTHTAQLLYVRLSTAVPRWYSCNTRSRTDTTWYQPTSIGTSRPFRQTLRLRWGAFRMPRGLSGSAS